MAFNGKFELNGILKGTIGSNSSLSGKLANEALRGYSAYELAVLNGFDGTEEEWLESLKSAVDLKPYSTTKENDEKYQPKGEYADKKHTHDEYLTEHQDLSGYVTKEELENIDIPTSWNDLKDKPFYEVESVQELYSDTLEFEFVEEAGLGACNSEIPYQVLRVDQKIKVAWNDVEYDLVLQNFELEPGALIAGNGSLINAAMGCSYEDTGEPFLIACLPESANTLLNIFTNSTEKTHDISISSVSCTTFKLDKKYIPTHEHSWNDLTDRPFHEPMEEAVIENKELHNHYNEMGTGRYSFEGKVVFDTSVQYKVVVDGEEIIVGYPTSETEFNFKHPDGDSSYWTYDEESNTTGLSLKGYDYTTISIYKIIPTKQIDEKFLPETAKYQSDWNENDPNSASYVKNRPFYSEQKIIMPKTTFTLEDQGGQYGTYIADRYELETGKNYKVICNDIEYNCTAHTMSDPGGWCLGNDLVMGGSEDTGEPFLIMILNKMAATQIGVGGVVIYNTTSPMDITVSIIEEEGIIHKLDVKFLPDGLADIALEALAECGVNTPLSNENNVVYTNSDGKIYTL